MSTKEKILNSISNNKPEFVELPDINLSQITAYENLVAKFSATVESIGGKVILIQTLAEIKFDIIKEMEKGLFIVDTIFFDAAEINNLQSATALEKIDKAYIKGTIAVAENGAVWIKESQMINRLLPFISQHLIIVIEKQNIVATMHQAYQQINSFQEGFGVFIAGPSKTADIEQSLVIGAHGARSLIVYLIN